MNLSALSSPTYCALLIVPLLNGLTMITVLLGSVLFGASIWNHSKPFNIHYYDDFKSSYCGHSLKINRIWIFCPVVTEKSTNPSVKLTLSMPRLGQVNLTRGLVDFSVTNGQLMLIIFLLYVPKRYFSDVNVGKLEGSSRATLQFRRVCLCRHNHFTRETGRVARQAGHSGQIVWITLWIWEKA